MSCSVSYFKITYTKGQEKQLFQGRLPVKMEVTDRSPGFLHRESLSLVSKKETSATHMFISLLSLLHVSQDKSFQRWL